MIVKSCLNRKQLRRTLTLTLVAFIMSASASAASLVVTNTNDNGTGSLRDALTQANTNSQPDTITFDPGVFNTPQTITLTGGELTINTDGVGGHEVTVIGPGRNLLTISGNNAGRVFYLTTNANAAISRMTITAGNGVGASNSSLGGAIFTGAAITASFDDISVTNSSALLGGGIASSALDLSVTNSTISMNSSIGNGKGGGVYFVSNGNPLASATITNTEISNNTSERDDAGALVVYPTASISNVTVNANVRNGAPTGPGITGGLRLVAVDGHITDSTITNNSTWSNGGGLHISPPLDGTVIVKRTTVANNNVSSQGVANGCGIYNEVSGGTVVIMNSTISGNQCLFNGKAGVGSGGGGGIYNATDSAFVINTTISGNSTSSGEQGNGTGGGIHNRRDMWVINSTIVNNSAGGIEANCGPVDCSGGAVGGGGISSLRGNPIASLVIQNSIVADNAAGVGQDVTGGFTSTGNNLVEESSRSVGFPGPNDILNTDPLLNPLADNGGPTLTHSPTQASIAIHNGNNARAIDHNGIPLRFDQRGGCFYRYIGPAVDIGAYEFGAEPRSGKDAKYDFDGDCFADVSVFRPSVGEWWLLKSSDGDNRAFQFGASSDSPVPADYTGDGIADVAFFRPSSSEWFILRSEDNSFFAFPFGTAGDIPAPGDYDGDGKTDAAVFRPSTATWFINNSGGGITIQAFGATGDQPTIEDFDGDGRDDIAIFRPSVAEWWQLRSTDGVTAFQFGSPSDRAVPADYTGDGKADVGFFRPSSGEWFILRSEDNSFFAFPFGASGDIPAPGDYDADGLVDAAVFRPSINTWFLNGSTNGVQIIGFGVSGDIPLPSVYTVP